jgi:NSS family neurotransmitter:Na+ symporter
LLFSSFTSCALSLSVFGVMLGELALGRKTGSSAVGTYAYFSKKPQVDWISWSYIRIRDCRFLQCFGRLVMRYMVGFMLQLLGLDGFSGQVLGFFGSFLFDYGGMLFFFALFVYMNVAIVSGGIKTALKSYRLRHACPLLPADLCRCLRGFPARRIEGYKYMFKPNFDVFKEPGGFFNVLSLRQDKMFFSLSLGMGAMITYGSYLSKEAICSATLLSSRLPTRLWLSCRLRRHARLRRIRN